MLKPSPRCFLRWFGGVFTILLACSSQLFAQKIDLNGNGMSDVWETLFDATTVNPNLDSDGDGVSNSLESIAGTNPFDANSLPRIPFVGVAGTNVSITMPSALGKFYQSQSLTTLGGNWTNETGLISRTGTNVTLNSSANVSAKFFRVVISDVDTDGDGLNDWEEYQLGLDPFSPASSGQLDANGQPLGDLAYATAKLGLQNRVTITATDPTATEPDLGQSPTSTGMYIVTRDGFPLNSVTVNLGLGGPGTNYAVEGLDHAVIPRPVTFPAGVSSQTIPLTPLANSNLTTPVIALLNVLPGTKYVLGSITNASVIIYPSVTPTGTGLTGQYFTNASSNYISTANFNPANLKMTRVDTNVDFAWGNTTNPILNTSGYYTVRWTGQVQPQYSEMYYFVANTDDGVKLWVNNQLVIDNWVNKGPSDITGSISLQGGVRYNIKMEYYQNTGGAVAHLSWYSASQPKQIIPTLRLYALSTNAPAVITSAINTVGFLGQPFSFNLTGANTPLSFTAKGLPPGLSLNSTNGLISGIPTLAGNYSVSVTASNTVGSGASALSIQIFDTGSAVTREIWTNIPGTSITDIPVNATANIIMAYGALEGITDYGDNYAERIRGYLTAPATGNYYFWIAGSDAAELWISNDDESVNKVRRAYTSGGTDSRQWNLQPKQKSGWRALMAGQKYYIEVLHKAGASTNDNWSAGWLLDPVGTNNTPNGVVPGYVLSRYFALPPSFIPGTLYAANMLAQGTAISSGVGSATLRVSADGAQAVLRRSFSGLSSAMTGEHIHSDAYLTSPSQIMFDIDAAVPQADGSFVWNIAPVGTLSTADIQEIIREGKAYINIHTVNYPAGEINGHFTLAEGSQTFTPPPAPLSWADDHSSSNAASRFLIQSTFGPSLSEIASVQTLGYDAWISNQFSLPPTYHLPLVLAGVSSDPTTPYPGNLMFNTWWKNSVTAPDQLRQRVAFALSEIMVVSENGVLQDNARALADYYDTLLDNSFGNFRELLKAATLTPAMGLYLDMRKNDKADLTLGTHANENYAREIMQLFSIGLNRLWPDGTLVMNSQGTLVPTYDQSVVNGFAAVFTGWNYYQANQTNGRLPTVWNSVPANYINPMVLVPTHHDLSTKQVLDNIVLPAAIGAQAVSSNTNFDIYCAQDFESALDSIFYNENIGPFICRQLIQRLVTSNPSRDYLYRVVQKFNDNGSGVRGDMQAVIRAILLDYEARSTNVLTLTTYGKQREPLLRVTAMARAFPSPPTISGTYSQNGLRPITISTAPTPHGVGTNDTVFLNFTDTSTNSAPTSQGYGATILSPTSFTVNAPGMTTGTYGQSGSVITVANVGHGLTTSNSVYLVFTTGGALNGVYPIVSVPSSSNFTVTATDSATRSGNCLFPKWSNGGFTKTGTNILMSVPGIHGLNVGDNVSINFAAGAIISNGIYQITSVPDATHFVITSANPTNQTANNSTIYPLVTPILTRSGTVTLQQSTWTMNATDTGTTSSLLQTPLSPPTVFNFFFPDYKFPGLLASAGVTTPEFQLTSDTSVVLQMNFLEGGLLNNTGNTNGLSSFSGGNGNIVLDLSPWMTPNYTAGTGVSNLVENLNTLLLAGQLNTRAKTNIIGYVTNIVNFPYTTPTPTPQQVRDRVRATIHLITASPDFTIQK